MTLKYFFGSHDDTFESHDCYFESHDDDVVLLQINEYKHMPRFVLFIVYSLSEMATIPVHTVNVVLFIVYRLRSRRRTFFISTGVFGKKEIKTCLFFP